MSEERVTSEKDERSAKASDAGTGAPSQSATGSNRRPRLIRVLLVLSAAAACTWVALYWQDRPLAEVERTLATGDVKRALSLVNYYLSSHPTHGRALALKGRVLVAMERADEAAKLYEENGAETADDLHAWAKAYLLRQQWSRAYPVLAEVLKRRPTDPDAMYEYATCRIRLGLLDDALDTAEQLTALPGQEARGWLMQAAIYNDLENYERSTQAYEKALVYSPDALNLQLPPDEVFLQYGSVFLSWGKPAEASELLQRSVAARPTATAFVELGKAFSQTGRAQAAAEAWKQAVKLAPESRAAREALATASLEERDVESAKKWLAPLVKSGDLRSTTAYVLQRVATMAGDRKEAAQWTQAAEKLRRSEQLDSTIEQILLRTPKSYWSNVIRAHRFATAGNWAQARDMINELSSDDPKDDFVRRLRDAIEKRGTLPPLDELPIPRF